MRRYRIIALLLFVLMVFVPYITVSIFGNFEKEAPHTDDPEKNEIFEMEISLYRTKTKKVEKVKCYDYICAVVAGEMQANYDSEALKAQTVAAFTYMVNKMNYVKENPDSDIGHHGAYVCDDYTHCKAYLEKQDALKKWGEEWYKKYYPNIENAVSESLGRIITYDGSPVNAVFHSVSNGQTCSAYEVWGTEVPYLQSVECAVDKTANDYESTASFTHEQFSAVLYNELGVVLPNDYNTWLGEIKTCQSGMIDEIVIAGTAYSGTHIRKMFGLRSSTFDVKITDKDVIFTVRGYGHGVGMSQYGANEMAKKGSTYEQILTYFYKDTKIEDYKVK